MLRKERTGNKHAYIPNELDKVLRNVMIEEELTSQAEALKKIAKYTIIGIEVKRQRKELKR